MTEKIMDDLLAIILKDTFSSTQFKTRVRLLKSNLLKSFFGSNAQNQDTSEGLPATQDLSWLKSLSESFYQKFNKDNVYNIFSSIEKLSANLPVLTMYLTFEPDSITLNQLGASTRQTFNSPSLLLDIKIDPNLIAGCALVWQGVYKDYSLRSKLEEKKAEISQEFKRFLR